MNRGRAALTAVLLAVAAVVVPLAGPAAANHDVEDDRLWVTIAVNAAGNDKISVADDSLGESKAWAGTASDVAIALDRPSGSFRVVEDVDGAHVVLRDKLATPDRRGGLSYAIDTGELQLLATEGGYEAILLKVCTPKVHQVVAALVTPERLPFESPGSRCRGWYQQVQEPAIRAVVRLAPDRQRYPSAVTRVAGTAAIAFGLLGIGATLLRRGPLRRRSVASWLVAGGVGVVVIPLGWAVPTVALWWTGATADPVLLGRGTVGEQVARAVLPGLAFLLPALLPAAVLLSAPRRPRPLPTSPTPRAPSPPVVTWWPTAWWGQWAASRAAPEPVSARRPPPSAGAPPEPPAAPPGWAQPG